MRKKLPSACLLDLKDTNNAFWWDINLNIQHTTNIPHSPSVFKIQHNSGHILSFVTVLHCHVFLQVLYRGLFIHLFLFIERIKFSVPLCKWLYVCVSLPLCRITSVYALLNFSILIWTFHFSPGFTVSVLIFLILYVNKSSGQSVHLFTQRGLKRFHVL